MIPTNFKAVMIALFIFSSFASLADERKPTIIALSPHIVEMLYAIGAGDQIIGTTDFANYPEAALTIPRIGNAMKLQLERVVAMQPDLIIAWQSGNPSTDLARLTELGLTIVYSEPKNYRDLAQEMIHFGQLTGNAEQANQQAELLLANLSALENRYKNSEAINVFYELWHKPLTTIAQGAWPQQNIDICNAVNPFEHAEIAYPQVNIEYLVKQSIQVIIQPESFTAKKENKPPTERFNWQQWPMLDAVKYNKILQPDADALHRMTPRGLVELKNLCDDIDQARQFYQTINH